MNTALYITNITTLLHTFSAIVKTKNSLNLTDESIHAENLFCHLLNTAFNWNLENVNYAEPNQDSFDLKDDSRGLYIQVTSNKSHSTKKRTAIHTFQESTTVGVTKLFKILYISDKASAAILASKEHAGFRYEGWDIPELIKDILKQNTTAAKLQPINDILQTELSGKLIVSPLSTAKTPVPRRHKLPTTSKDQIHIPRDKLTNDLFNFTQGGNGLLVGGPGEGKSYLTEALYQKYVVENIPCHLIRIDTLLVGTDEEIASELGIKGDWIVFLSQLPKPTTQARPLLIFDAFDAAKDPALKGAVMHHIRKAVETLSDSWSILVSARIYDASKSTRLLTLFPREDSRQPISCRHFQIPLLEISDIKTVLKQKGALSIFDKLTSQLQQLLRIPYFLTIFGDLLTDTNKDGQREFETVETEEQLLQIYWRKRVLINTANTTFIQRLTDLLSSKMMLACKRTDIADETHSSIIDDLLSSGIIGESASGLHVSFTHNILLDYAISIYVISEDPVTQIDYLGKNEMHWFLFRSAYIYFFGRLWRLHRDLFWKHFLKIREIDNPAFRLFRQTILNYVIGTIYQSIDDIHSAINTLLPEEKAKIKWKILEALRFLNKDNVPEKEYQLLSDISTQLDDVSIWEVGFLIDRAIDQASTNHDTRLLRLMSTASLNYLHFALDRRKSTLNRVHIDRNAVHWGIRSFYRYYEYNRKPGRKVTTSLLEILNEPDFHIPLFTLLSDKISHIAPFDVHLAKTIFKKLYAHMENSDIRTSFSSDVTLTLSSNRGQDFQSIHYALERLFPSLLEKHPQQFLALGINIINTDYCRVYPYTKGPRTTPLSIGKEKGNISPDYHRYINDFDKKNGIPSFITHIFIYLQTLADKKDVPSLQKSITILIKKSQAASLWKELIQFTIKNITLLKKVAFNMLSEKRLLLFGETNSDAVTLLTTAYQTLSITQQKLLQKTIKSIKAADYPKRDKDSIERMKSSLLNCISPSMMATPGQGRPHQTKYSPIRRPDPASTTEATSPLPAAITSGIASLKQFNDRHEGQRQAQPTVADCAQLLPDARNLFNFRLETSLSEDLLYDCDHETTRYTSLISQKCTELTPDVRLLIENISLFYLDTPLYQVHNYQPGALSGGIHTFSPTPRIYSVQSLVQLVHSDTTGNIRKRLLPLYSDNDQSVRFIVLHTLHEYWHKDREDFWTIVSDRIPVENNPACLQILLQGVSYLDIINDDKEKVEALAISASRVVVRSEDRLSELFQAYAILLLRLYNSSNSKVAHDILHTSIAHKQFLSSLIFILVTFIDPRDETNEYENNSHLNKNCFQLLSDILNTEFEAIQGKAIATLTSDDIESIDTVFSQLYYTVVLGRKEAKDVAPPPERKAALYLRFKPIFSLMIDKSEGVGSGFIVGHTGYHFLQLLEHFFTLDPAYLLGLIADTVRFSAKNNLTYSQSSLRTIVKMTELILADYPDLLITNKNFANLITILDLFADSGWFEAVELTMRLKEIF